MERPPLGTCEVTVRGPSQVVVSGKGKLILGIYTFVGPTKELGGLSRARSLKGGTIVSLSYSWRVDKPVKVPANREKALEKLVYYISTLSHSADYHRNRKLYCCFSSAIMLL